jgi:hypothetical protein
MLPRSQNRAVPFDVNAVEKIVRKVAARVASRGPRLLLALLFSTQAVAVPFERTYNFQGGFHIFGHLPYPQTNGFDYYFTPLAVDSSLSGEAVTIHSITVSSFGHNQGEVINFDWEVYLGPSPFGLPEGQFIGTHVDPVAGYSRSAPTQLRFVIGDRYDTQSYMFSGHFDFLTHTMTAAPHLSALKAAFTSPMDLPDGLYAQVFLWTADNRDCNIEFDQLTLIVRGDIEGPAAVAVSLDIMPGSDPANVNPRSGGVIPVAILSTADFDATQVDPQSVEFGPNGAKEAHGDGHVEDVNGDGWADLLLHFATQATGLRCGDTDAHLAGETFDGQAIEGTDDIVTVGCNSAGTALRARRDVRLGGAK